MVLIPMLWQLQTSWRVQRLSLMGNSTTVWLCWQGQLMEMKVASTSWLQQLWKMANYTFARLKLETRDGLREQEDLWRAQQVLSVLPKNLSVECYSACESSWRGVYVLNYVATFCPQVSVFEAVGWSKHFDS